MSNMLDYILDSHRDPGSLDIQKLSSELKVFEEFCESYGLSAEQICGNYLNREGCDDHRKEELIHKTESLEMIKEYYASTKMYLIELALHECQIHYFELYRIVEKFVRSRSIRDTLDFGAGAGGLVVHLNKIDGVKCDYADIPGKTWDYAKFRFTKSKLSINQLTKQQLIHANKKYNLITGIDCLEHFKNLPKYIELFASLLTENGYLIMRPSFYGIGLHLKSNHIYNDLEVFNEMMKGKDFRFKGQLTQRLNVNILIPSFILKLLGIKTASGKNLVYQKIQ